MKKSHYHCRLCKISVRVVNDVRGQFYCGSCNGFMGYEGVKLFGEDD